MDDIKALETRITDALDRIAWQLSKPKAALVAEEGPSKADLIAQLEDERRANTQLEERVGKLKARQDGQIADLEKRASDQAAQIAALDVQLQQLRGSNADLTDVCAKLRAAAADGVAEAELINRALIAEVDGLTAQRSAEAAEVAAILSDLKPMLQQEA
ncbi:hypothetical protein [Loktanella sp. R86503]|uniref:hypothetical protein n=1 Tax=Loktanella sp. R86503 TaxID=3093847 RepID=UPI0036D7A9BA